MAINKIEYEIDTTGISPSTEQCAGIQGDHMVTQISFKLSENLYSKITDIATKSKVMFRFDVYDSAGGIWTSEASEFNNNLMDFYLEERHTRFGGKLIIYLVVTQLSDDLKTVMELYSFPATLRLRNKPNGISCDSENRESISSLVEIAKDNALAAETSNQEVQQLASQIEEKLKNGDFDGVGVESAVIINDELIITYTDGTVQNLGNVKGDTGPQGEKGDKGDTPDVSGFVEKVNGNTVTDQVYAVNVIGQQMVIDVEVNDLYANGAFNFSRCIPRRNNNGNLYTGNPIEDLDCANKQYVDDIVGNIETVLGGI